MAGKIKKEASKKIGTKPLITVDSSLPSFEGHAFFEKKATSAKALLKKVGLPRELTKKTQAQLFQFHFNFDILI